MSLSDSKQEKSLTRTLITLLIIVFGFYFAIIMFRW